MTEPPGVHSTAFPSAATEACVDWAESLRGHAAWIRSVLAARVGSDEVDELMQEVAVAAVAAKSPPRDPSKVGPWLYRIAVRQVLQHRRRIGRRKKLLNAVAQRTPDDSQRVEGPLAWLLADERQQLVREALNRLTRRDREILMLKYGHDWSYQQLSDHLGISRSAVEARLHRARKKLRDLLTS